MAADPINGTLAEGLLSNSTQVIYTVPDGMVTRIRWISVFNDTAGIVTCTFHVRRHGNRRRIARADLAASGGHARFVDRDEDLRLSEGDAIEGGAGSAGVIEFVVSGEEELVE